MLPVQRSPCFDDYFSLVFSPRLPQLKVPTGQLRLSHLAGRNPLNDKLEDDEHFMVVGVGRN